MIDMSTWDTLLHEYVDRQGRVDYRSWQKSSQVLTQWLDGISTQNLETGSEDERLAFWLNLYNALTIAQILQRYPIASIQPKILGIPNWIAFFRFFSRPVYTVGEQRYSLNHIEHKILRQQFNEPRIHFALVCASVGCPLLRDEAYQPERVREQLENDARRFINNPDKVKYDTQVGVLYCSKIFKWYRQDFLKVATSVPNYIRSYLLTGTAINSETPICYLAYDWSLNQQ